MHTRFFAAGIRWHFPGRSPFGGDYEGIGQVLDWLGRTFQASDGTIRIELHDVIGNDEHVVALTTLRAERAGKRLQDNTVQIFHLQDGNRGLDASR